MQARPAPHLELVISPGALVSGSNIGTFSIEGVIATVKGGVMGVTIPFTHTVTTHLWIHTTAALANQPRGAEAAWGAWARFFQATGGII